VLWVLALGWLVRREYFRPPADVLLDAALTIPPGGTFLAARVDGEQIGTASMTADTLADGFRIIARHDLDLPFADRAFHLVSVSDAEYSRDLRLRTFTSRLTAGDEPYVITGAVTGDSLLTVRAGPANSPPDITLRQPLSGPIGLAGVEPFMAALHGALAVGSAVNARVFDPATLTLRYDTLRVRQDSVFIVADSADLDSATGTWVPATFDTLRAYRLTHLVHGLPETLWVDASGFVVRGETPAGAAVERSAFELVSENYRRRGIIGVARPAAWPALTGPAPSGVPGFTGLRVLLEGLSLGPDPGYLDTPWQHALGDTLETYQKARDTLPVLVEDYRLPSPDREAWALLTPGPYDGSDPRVAAQARRVVGSRARSVAAVAALIEWIHANIRPDPEPNLLGPREASRVLDRRLGDASGQAVLFVAMARAVGLPARPVAGLLLSGDRFHYHCWAEVWLGEWVPVDPALGQRFADPGHLRLAVGTLGLPAALAPWIGRLRPRVLSRENQR